MPATEPPRCRSTPLSANATTTISKVPTILHSITINTKGATGNTITAYDALSATGTPIATIDSTAAIGTLFYDIQCLTGLTIVIGTGTAANITVADMP